MKNIAAYKIYIKPILVIGSSILIIGIVILPQILAYFSVRTKINGVTNRTSSLQAKASELQGINETEYIRKIGVVLTALPKEKDVPYAMLTLQNIINRSGLILDTIKVIDSPTSKEANSFVLDISIAGQKESVKSFLLSLLDSPRIFKLESINAQSVKNGTSLEADIELLVYYDPSSTVATNPDNPLPTLTQADEQLLQRYEKYLQTNSLPATADTLQIPSGKQDPFE